MLANRIIPCLDVKDGRVVKGVQFQNLRDMGDPAQLAAAYQEQGADEIVVLDVTATVRNDAHGKSTTERVRQALGIPLTVGGGIRSAADAERVLWAGADKVSVNSAAVSRPALIDELARRFGSQCTVIAVDAIQTAPDRWVVTTKSGTEKTEVDVIEWVRECESRGAGEILLTSWDRDGTHSGYDLPLLHAVTGAIALPVIASGGASGPEHILEAFQAGATGALAASIFHDGKYDVATLKDWLAARGEILRR